MATKKVLVLNDDGTKQQIAATDTIPVSNLGTGTPDGTKFLRDDGTFATPAGSGGVTILSGTSILNFGNENDYIKLTISDALITNTNVKSFSFIPQETSETSLDDFSLNGVSFTIANIINNTSFDIIGTASNEASGNYTIKYLIII
jgi:hypothetical protein